ncbi:MAG: glycosyltransferase family 2 protein [Magnetococcales bacterium]|nr:glycosyltransferase family 2 protein [Magnetococcales bacterium]
MPSVSIIIPTYHRPDDLGRCIQSILQQTRLPEELLIIDDGALEQVPLQPACEQAGIRVVYHRKNSPGLTASRNVGIDLSQGDIIFFLDDDVVLYPEYVAAILEVYDQQGGADLGGVGGVINNHKPLTVTRRLRHLFDVFFLASSFREGTVLASGFCTDYGTSGQQITQTQPVDFLPGGVSSFPRRIFEKHRFSEKYKGYGLGEDKDFTFRVARDNNRLLITPHARLDHFHSGQMRYDKRRMGRESILARYLFFRDFLDTGPRSRLPFWYAISGYLLARILILILSGFRHGEAGRVAGMFGGVLEVLKGRAPAPGETAPAPKKERP